MTFENITWNSKGEYEYEDSKEQYCYYQTATASLKRCTWSYEVTEVAEELHSSNDEQTKHLSIETMTIKVLCINTSQIQKSLEGMSQGKAGGADDLSIHIIKDGCNFVLDKLALLFTSCIQTCSNASPQKNAIVVDMVSHESHTSWMCTPPG